MLPEGEKKTHSGSVWTRFCHVVVVAVVAVVAQASWRHTVDIVLVVDVVAGLRTACEHGPIVAVIVRMVWTGIVVIVVVVVVNVA